jgi:hypothetical protein
LPALIVSNRKRNADFSLSAVLDKRKVNAEVLLFFIKSRKTRREHVVFIASRRWA